MADTIYYRFVVKQDTAANFTAKNTLLLSGEFGYETDTKKRKFGDGVTPWVTLPYESAGGSSSPMHVNLQASTTYTLVATDVGGDVQFNNAAPVTTTIPKDTFTIGDWLLCSQTGAGVATFIGATGVTFETAGTNATIKQGDVIGLEMIAANVWRFIGGVPGIGDAPSDSSLYGRKNGAWTAVPTSSGSSGQLAGLNDQTNTSYTVAATDAGKDIRCTNAAAIALNINTQAVVPVAANFWALVSQGGAGVVTITALAGVTLRAANGAATSAIYDARGIERITGDEWRAW